MFQTNRNTNVFITQTQFFFYSKHYRQVHLSLKWYKIRKKNYIDHNVKSHKIATKLKQTNNKQYNSAKYTHKKMATTKKNSKSQPDIIMELQNKMYTNDI